MACDEHEDALNPSTTTSAPGAGFYGMVGQSAEMRRLFRTMAKVASGRQPLLLLGEGGTGKHTAAESIHAQGRFPKHPFLSISCISAPSKLMELELFARLRRAPFVSSMGLQSPAATTGTVFLDEVGALPPELQARLVRALQERETRAADDSAFVEDPRIIAASSRDLEIAVQQGTFRRDLYLRLNVTALRFPALRDRRGDICLLAEHFLAKIGAEKRIWYSLSHDSVRRLLSYDWPGNLDELKNSLERAAAKSSGTTLEIADLTSPARPSGLDSANLVSRSNRILPLAEVEKQTILSALERLNGDKLLTARALGIGKTTLYRKLREYGIFAS